MLLEGAVAVSASEGAPLTPYQAAEALGWNPRRLSATLQRAHLTTDEVASALQHWARRRPPLEVVQQCDNRFVVQAQRRDLGRGVAVRSLGFEDALASPLGRLRDAENRVHNMLSGQLEEEGCLGALLARAARDVSILEAPALRAMAFAEVVRTPMLLPSIRSKSPVLDQGYVSLLTRLREEGALTFETERLAAGQQRDAYRQLGIVSSEVVLCHADENCIWYTSTFFDAPPSAGRQERLRPRSLALAVETRLLERTSRFLALPN